MPNTGERRFKRGQIICKPGEMDMNMYNILYGSVAVYKDYGTPEEVEVVTLSEGDFLQRHQLSGVPSPQHHGGGAGAAGGQRDLL